MEKNIKIVLVGGGSVNWSPKLINDLLLTPGLENVDYCIHDLDREAGEKMVRFGQQLSLSRGLECKFDFAIEQKDAFMEADFVIITISTGDLDAMEHDLKIPQDYGIYQTVGDTVGPGGWARGLRNIPVFAQMSKNIEKYSPNAVVLNYTNPLSVLTNVFYKTTKLKTVGLCHGLFEVYDILIKIFDLAGEEEINVNFGGINHFFWLLDMKIRGEDGYELLKRKMNGRHFYELIKEIHTDSAGFSSNKYVCSELLEYFGYLPYVGDRHISEFIPNYLTGVESKLEKYKLKRTFIEERRADKQRGREKLDAYIKGESKIEDKRSRETAADIISSFVNGKEFIDVVNLPNIGQISNLPLGSIVETLGVINSRGFTPLSVGNLPDQILNLVLPHARNQDMIIEAGLEGNLEKAFSALYNDPLCAHLTYPEIKEMGMKLLKAHSEFLPQFEL